MGQGVRFNILGPVECWTRDGESVPLGGALQQKVLTCLLLSAGHVVPVSRLIETGWTGDPPTTAIQQMRKVIAELRRRIPGGRSLVTTTAPGYRIDPEPDQLDVTRFQDLLRDARRQAGEGETSQAISMLRTALRLWRGPVMGGIGGDVVDAASRSLEERRLAAAEQLFELRLARGESVELIEELQDLVTAHPLRETLHGHLMLALYRSGRQAEALVQFDRTRRVIIEELGADPSPQLANLHERILRQDRELAGPVEREPAWSAPPPVGSDVDTSPAGGGPSLARPPVADGGQEAYHSPGTAHRCTLPYDIPDFTGRERELRRLLDEASPADGWGGPVEGAGPRIVAIDGMGGSGKTSLAVRTAHRLSSRYPDAHLYLDLRGFTPGEAPLAPDAVAGALLRMLDVPGELIPEDPGGRLALWRTTALQHRMTLVLDNVADSAQIREVLPACQDLLVLITSRSRLVELDGVRWMSLGPMAPEDCHAFVVRTLGAQRTAAEGAAVQELIELCGRLPLALRIATARLHNRAHWTVEHLVSKLRDEASRVDELRAGERTIAASLLLSYKALEPAEQAAFQLLAKHPGTDMDAYSVAALLDVCPGNAEDLLESLLDTHLIQQHEVGRYVFHDLVRSFALWLEGQVEGAGAPDESEALDRLVEYYFTTTYLACDLAFPGRGSLGPKSSDRPVAGTFVLPPLRTPREACGWLNREEPSLLAVVALAYHRGMYRHTAEIARNIVFQLDARGRLEEYRNVAETAVAAARKVGDQSLVALGLANLAIAHWKLGTFDEGLKTARESLELSVRHGDRRGEAKSSGTLGLLLASVGRSDEALTHLERSIGLKRELNAPRAEAESLSNLSTLLEQGNRCSEAVAAAERAVELNRRIGARVKEIVTLTDLAQAHLGLNEDDRASTCLDRALDLCEENDTPGVRAMALALSAEVQRRFGDQAAACRLADEAVRLARSGAPPVRQAAVCNTVAAIRRKTGDPDAARALHEEALAVASAMGYQPEVLRAQEGLARC